MTLPTDLASDRGWPERQALERIVRLVTRILGVPAAATALIEGDRLTVVASVGCTLEEMPRKGSLPGCTLDCGERLVVPDLAALDPAPPVPLVAGRPMRFYVGVPVRDPDGELAGVLCAGDVVPRELDAASAAALDDLAALVSDQLLLVRELAEHRRLGARLAASERRFEDFAETASDWFWEMDAGLRFSWLSDAIRSRFGLEPAWHYGKTRLELAATEADRAVAEQIQELMLRREPFRDFEYCRRSPTGDHWLRISGKPIFDESGRFRGYRGTGRDITALKREEAARRAAEERYRRLVELLPDGVVLHREGRVVYANAKAVEILGGRSLEDVKGVSTLDLCEPEARATVAGRIRRLAEPGAVLEPYEFRIRRLDGRWIDVETRGVAVEDGDSPAALVVVRDVTEHKAAEEARREAELRYRALVELNPDPVVLVEDGRFAFSNPPAARLFGVASPSELVGRSIYDFFPTEQHATIRSRHALKLLPGEVLPPTELVVVRPDGSRVAIEAKGSLVVHEGRPMFLGVLRDIGARKAMERALKEAEERYRTIVEFAPVGLLLYRDGAYRLANRAAARILGARDPEELVGLGLHDLFAEPCWPVVEARSSRILAGERSAPSLELEMRRLDGTLVTVEATAAAIRDAGRPAIQAVIRDVTDERRAAEALREAEERYRGLVELSPEAVVVIQDDRYVFANQRAAELLGATGPGELLGRAHLDLVLEDHWELERERIRALLEHGGRSAPVELRLRRLDGRIIDVECSGGYVGTGGRPAVQKVLRDISRQKALEAELRRLAHHDPLTGLPNRLLFFDRLEQMVSRAEREERRGALLVLDLDGFKLINDTCGHDAGDALLRGVATRLRRVIRRSDTVVRLAGDEFAVLLYPLGDAKIVERIGQRILGALAAPIRHRGRALRAGASIGAAIYPDDATEPAALVRTADLALYRAKEQGRGRLAFADRGLRAALEERQRLGFELRAALEGGEVRVLWQPRVELASGRPIGLEAIPAWPHPKLAGAAPDELARLAEDAGIAREFAERVVELILDQLVAWRRNGLVIGQVAFQLTAAQLAAADLVDRLLERIVAADDLAPRDLRVELAERETVSRAGQLAGAGLARLRAAGIAVALDEVGPGAALGPLCEQAVDAINLEDALVRAVAGAGPSRLVLGTLVQLARGLGLDVTALGVSCEAERRALANLGCRTGEGPLWSTPMPAEEAAAWLGARAKAQQMTRRAGRRARAAATGPLRDP